MVPLLLVVTSFAAAPLRRPTEAVAAGTVNADPPRPRGAVVGPAVPGDAGRVLAAIAAVVVVCAGRCPWRPRRPTPRRPHHLRGPRRTPHPGRHPGTTVHAHRPDRRRFALEPAGQGGGPYFPRPGVHLGLSVHRPGVPSVRFDARYSGKRAVFVAVVANPIYNTSPPSGRSIARRGCPASPTALLTGSVTQLEKVWGAYGVEVEVTPAGSMVDDSDVAYVIGAGGRTRAGLAAEPGQGAPRAVRSRRSSTMSSTSPAE